jgi:hypothetical protein
MATAMGKFSLLASVVVVAIVVIAVLLAARFTY